MTRIYACTQHQIKTLAEVKSAEVSSHIAQKTYFELIRLFRSIFNENLSYTPVPGRFLLTNENASNVCQSYLSIINYLIE